MGELFMNHYSKKQDVVAEEREATSDEHALVRI